jgi:hypothetical protein
VRHDGTNRRIIDENLIVLCCTNDEGRPLGIGLQDQVSNRLELPWSKVMVVSVEGKGRPPESVR